MRPTNCRERLAPFFRSPFLDGVASTVWTGTGYRTQQTKLSTIRLSDDSSPQIHCVVALRRTVKAWPSTPQASQKSVATTVCLSCGIQMGRNFDSVNITSSATGTSGRHSAMQFERFGLFDILRTPDERRYQTVPDFNFLFNSIFIFIDKKQHAYFCKEGSFALAYPLSRLVFDGLGGRRGRNCPLFRGPKQSRGILKNY